METKFTMGPWVSFEYGFDLGNGNQGEGFGICTAGTSLSVVAGTADNSYVCEISQDNKHKMANACLIAAAPELLEACVDAKNLLINDLEEPYRTVFWKLVDAIAKATGAAQ